MRWKSGKPRFHGDMRTITIFLLLPRKISHEWRWLETVSIVQKANRVYSPHGSFLHWEDVKWVDKKEEVELK